ncbi:MAG: helix-hairpin-helix domain-containing protein [Polyangiaceae bacterium]|nr:helix-hairpin-helix domain-containing protein [Polyangiaceae bacterium]
MKLIVIAVAWLFLAGLGYASTGSSSKGPAEIARAPTVSQDAASQTSVPSPPKEDVIVLNKASPDDLRKLPGIGAKRAEAIVQLRTRLGRFQRVEDLMRVRGIGRKMFVRLKPLVKLDE